MRAGRIRAAAAAVGVVAVAGGLATTGAPAEGQPAARANPHDRRFERVATFPVYRNNPDPGQETVAEILDVSADGRTLLYTDSQREVLGFVDLTDPAAPQGRGTLPVGGEPTSVAVRGPLALVAVDTSPSAAAPGGHLLVVDVASQAVLRTIPLGGQPDSIDVSPDGRYAAVAIENQRDEDVVVAGLEGGLPQAPAGLLQVVDLVGGPAAWTVRSVDLTGLAAYAPGDPEPEYVDINDANRAVVTLQENNHLAVVDLASGRVLSHGSAGTVDLSGVDTVEDGVIDPTGTLRDVPREPDAAVWLDRQRFVTANEGDLFGGSRGFTVFDRFARVIHDSGTSFEDLAIRAGHHPEERSENKGTEPEGVEAGRYGADDLLFVGSERGSFVAVHSVRGGSEPRFLQLLPTGLAPEGLLAIPQRDLFVVSSEDDSPTFGVRSTISVYRLRPGPAPYPEVVSADGPDGRPIPWGALSGLAADPSAPGTLAAVTDSFYAQARILTLDVTRTPAVITGARTVTGGTGSYDLEGIAFAPDGTTWVASEGNATDSRANRLLQLDASGAVLQEVGLPAEVLACRKATTSRGSLGAGFEGVAVEPLARGGYRLLVAQQRGWQYTTPACEALDDDPTAGTGEPGWTRVWTYEPASGAWGHVPYELEPKPARAAWIGLSEITPLPDGRWGLIERDDVTGDWAETKWVTSVVLDDQVLRADKRRLDLLPLLRATRGWITDKPEGFAVASDGRAYVVTDNDGVDGWSGETQLLRLGPAATLFG